MKRLILSLGILFSALAPKVASAQSSPCLNDVTAPDTNWTAGNVGRTSANPLIIKLNPAGYAAIVADSGNGQAGVNLAKVYVPSQFTQSGVSADTILSAQDDCADTYTGSLAARWPKVTISKGAFTCADANATSVNAMAVSYNVFDAANNVLTGTIWVKVIETINPVLSVKPATLTLSAGGSATLIVADVLVSATDNCGTPNVTLSKTAFGCGDIGSNNVTVTATDASGNTATQTAVVTVVDATAPVLVVKNATVNLSAGGTVTLLESDVVTSATDVCDNTVTVSFTPTSFTCANLGNNTVTITATDDSGNNTVQTVTVTVKDILAPTLTVTDYTLNLDASGSATLVNSNVVVTSSDNCGTPTVTLSKSSFTCSDLGANNVTVTSTDGSGNITTQTSVVTVKDVTNPAVVGKNATIILNASGAATLTNADVVLSSSDNCGTPTVTLSKTSFDCTNLGTNTVTLTATDGSLNTATTTVTVTVVDDLKPSLVVVASPKTFNLDASGAVTLVNSDLVTSSSDNCGAPTVTLSDYSFDCSDINTVGHVVTVTAVDASGNTETKTVTVLIQDVTNPVLNVQSYTLNLGSNGTATLTNANVVTSATDNCGTPTVTLSKSSFDCSNLGANSVTVTATDASGNTSTQTATVTVKDVTAPILTKLTYERDLSNGFALLSVQDVLNEIAFDACGVDYTTSALSREYFDCEDVGSSTITASIRDFSGNFAFVNFTVIIHDKVAPIANAKASHTIYLDANGNASVTAADVDNGSSDDCDNFTLSLSQTSFDCDDLGSNTVTFTISDEEVNSSTASVNIIVSDTIRPDWASAAGVNILSGTPFFTQFNGACNAPNAVVGSRVVGKVFMLAGQSYTLELTDCFGDGYLGRGDVFSLELQQKNGLGIYSTVGTYGTSFNSGNSEENCLPVLTTSDTVRFYYNYSSGSYFGEAGFKLYNGCSTIASQLSETVYLDQNGSASMDPQALFGSYASDNCDFAVTSNQTTFTCVDAAASPVTITLTATDDAGNTRNTTAVITVLDTLSPAIALQNPYSLYLDANGTATLDFSDIDNGTEDNCTPLANLNVVLSKTAFDCGVVAPVASGTPYLVYVMVTDEYNNDRTVPITVNVFDTISPSVTVASYTLNLGALGTATLTEADVVTAKSDNCTSPTVTLSKTAFNCNDKGANNVVVTATDDAGNTTYKTVVVTVEDNLDPTLTSKDVTVYLDATGSASITNADVLLTSADNCGTPTVTLSNSTFSCSDIGANTVTLTATDGSGNTATTTSIVTVSDTTRPALALLSAPKTFSLGTDGTVTITNADLVSSATDNCGVPTVVLSKYVFDCDDINPSGELVTVTATDGSSNANVKTFLVKIVDDAAPDFNTPFVPADVTVYAVQYDCFGLVNVDSDPLPTAFDNCDINVDIERHWAGKIASGIIPMPVGLHTLWAVATDDYGNTDSTAYAYVEVIDTTLPDATFWNNVTVVLGSNGTANITPATIIDASYDNCGIENIIISPNVVDCDDLASNVTLTVTLVDFNGNIHTYNPVVVVEDQAAPTFVPLAGAATVSLSAIGTASVVWQDLVDNVTDNCSVVSVSLSQSSFNCSDLGVNNIVITATDASGNVATYTAVLNVVDDMDPAFATKNITVALNNSGNATIVPSDVINGSASDNCSNVFTYTLSKSFFDCTNVGVNNVNVSVSDVAGNTTTISATVTIVDDIDPTLSLANALVTVALDANGQAALGVSEIVGLAADNCSIQSVILSQTAFDCTDLGNGTVTVTATDVNGNTTTAIQNIVVVDLVAPVVTVKSSATVKQLDATGAAVISQSDILTSVTDNCTASPAVIWSPTSVSCAQVGPVTVSITVTDASGNVTTTTKVIQVVDELAPSLAVMSYTAILNANGNVTIIESNVVDTKSDNCGLPVVTLSKSVFDCTNKGVNNVLVTATDVNGNATTKTAVVTVVDQTAPSMVLAGSLTVSLNGAGTANISVPDVVTAAEDNCDVPTVTLSKYTYTCADMPSTSITVTAVDAAGNSTVETFTVNVVDALAPVITTKSTTTTIALDANGSAPVVFADVLTSVIDNCTASPTITWFPTTVTCAQVGPVTVSITTTDASGNVSVASKVIQVVDNINPTLVTKAYTAVLNANGNATVVESNVVQSKSDNCGVPAVLMSKTEFDCTNKGANNVTVTATDANGNVTTETAVVTVVDQMAPFFTTAPSLTVFLDANGVATVSVPDVVTSSGDNCDIPTVTLSKYTFTCSDMPSTSIAITAVDASGNTTTGTYTVNVLDQLAPVITPKSTPTTIALDATGNAPVTLSDIMGTAVDNCTASPVVTWVPTTVTCAQVGPVTVTITALDESGNFSTSTKIVQVVDDIKPTLVTKAYTAVLNANGNATIVESNVVQSKSDNCGVPAVLMSKTEFDCTNKGANNVTVTATDANGNVMTQTAVVTVVDQTAPFFTTAPSLTVFLDANGVATVSVPDVVTSSGDNCDIPTVTLSKYTFTCSDMPSTSITITAVDASGNTTTGTYMVNVLDQLAPVITPKSTPTTIALDATGNAAVTLADVMGVAVDNCTANPVVSWFPTSVSCAQVGSVTVYITATDASGNFSNSTKVIQVVDNINPTLVTKAYTAVLNANGNATIVESNVVQSKSDNCGVPAVLMSKTEFDCTNKGANNVTVTATDANGNVTTQTAVVTVVDQTAPFFTTAPSLTLLLNANGVATVSVPDVVTSSGDNCDVVVTLSKYTFTCSDMPSTSITVTAVDGSGNTTTDLFTVNVLDQLAPVITPKSTPTTIALDATGNAPVTLIDIMGTAVDNCTASPVVTWVPTTVTCAQVGPVTVTITALDESGNFSTSTKIVQVVDDIKPTLVTKAYTAVLNANGNATIVESNVVQSKSDNCGVPAVLMSKTEFDCTNKGANNVTVTATDANGNVTTQTAVVTVVDQTAPFFTTAPSLTVLLNANGVATVSVPDVVTSSGDNCDVVVTLSKYTFTCSDMPSTSITVTAVDGSGNTTTGAFTVNVLDQLAPAITPKATPTTIALDATGNATVKLADVMGVAVDNCTANPVVTWFPTSVSCAQVGPVTVTITATDASGNFSNATKVIQVVDNISPTLVTKAFTAVLNANGNATIVESNVVQSKSDNCGVPAVLMSKTVFDCTNKGTNNVTVTATDANGNVTTQTAVVTVVDQTAPFFTTAPSLTLLLNATGTATISVPSVVTSSGDNCDVPTVTLSKYTFTCADMPSTSITITAVDASGNTTTGTYTVNVLDQLAPVITPKSTPTTIALDATGNAPVTLADVMGAAVDNCTASPVVTWFPTSVSCAQVGPVTVTITAVDASGNVSNATKVIQVIDNIAPTVVLKGTSLVTYTLPLNASGNATLTVSNVVNTATDNCGTPVVSLSKTAFDCSNLGDNVVVVTAVDQFGNVSTINAIVKVVDQTAPSIVTPSTQVVLNLSAGGTATLPLSQVMLSTVDNCGTPTVTWSPSTFNCSNLGNNTVTITSSDASGNVTTATVVVLVQDVTAPAITTVSGAVTKFLGTNGTVAITQADVVTAVTDACTNPVTVTWTPTTVSCSNVGNVAVVVTAIDASGNVSTAVKTILVRDQLAPVISAPASITLVLNAAGTVALPAGVASATDNCAVNGIQYSKSLFDCSNLGANTVTITATDVNGNVATSTMTVNVVDNSAPSLTLVASPLTVALNAAGSASVNAAQLVANANDNCAIASYTVTPNTFNCSSLGGNTVTVTATDASGNATSQTVIVNVVDVTGPSIVVNPAAVTVTLNANGVGSITNAQVVSSVSDNCTTTPSVVITPNVFTCADLGQQMVTIFATDAAGNISTTTKLITVVDASAPVIVSAPQNVTLPGCNGNFTYAYQVTDNCGYTATLVSGLASGTQFPVGTTTVTWSFADASGNTTTHSFNVTVLPLGSYTLPAVNEYCAGHGQFDLTAGQTGLVFYGSSVFNNGTTFYTEVPGIYALNFVFTDGNGCTQNGTFNLIVRPRPAKPSIVQVAATTLESSVTGATYQWYRNEQPIVGAKSKQYVFTAGGKYEVVVFNAYGCGTMSEGFVINANGLSVEEIITSVRLFPNPTSSSVTLETSFEAAEDLQVTLVDMLGSVVYRGTLNKGNNQHVLDMSGLAAGTYNVILTNANGASSNVQRVVKID